MVKLSLMLLISICWINLHKASLLLLSLMHGKKNGHYCHGCFSNSTELVLFGEISSDKNQPFQQLALAE